MSDKKTSKGNEPADDGARDPADTDDQAGTEADASFDAIENEVRAAHGEEVPLLDSQPRKSGFTAAIGWLALIIAALALLGVGYIASTGGDADQASNANQASLTALSGTLEATRSSLDTSRAAVEELQIRINRMAESDAARSRELAALNRQLDERLQQLGSLPERIANLEGSISSLQGISSGVKDTWLLREAEYYMQIANAQLQLGRNPELAILALQLADERILQLANPALTEVRRTLSDELLALETLDQPDLEGIALTLASLASVADSLPMRQELRPGEAAPADIDPELSGMDRALASLKRTLGDVVSVRRTDEAVQPLIAPEAQFFLRANLSLQLQAARLALLRSEQAIFQQSLDDASTWLNDYYDRESAPVRSALATIAEIRSSSFNVSLPDISGSLRLLRQFEVLSSAAADAEDSVERTPDPEPAQ